MCQSSEHASAVRWVWPSGLKWDTTMWQEAKIVVWGCASVCTINRTTSKQIWAVCWWYSGCRMCPSCGFLLLLASPGPWTCDPEMQRPQQTASGDPPSPTPSSSCCRTFSFFWFPEAVLTVFPLAVMCTQLGVCYCIVCECVWGKQRPTESLLWSNDLIMGIKTASPAPDLTTLAIKQLLEKQQNSLWVLHNEKNISARVQSRARLRRDSNQNELFQKADTLSLCLHNKIFGIDRSQCFPGRISQPFLFTHAYYYVLIWLDLKLQTSTNSYIKFSVVIIFFIQVKCFMSQITFFHACTHCQVQRHRLLYQF